MLLDNKIQVILFYFILYTFFKKVILAAAKAWLFDSATTDSWNSWHALQARRIPYVTDVMASSLALQHHQTPHAAIFVNHFPFLYQSLHR